MISRATDRGNLQTQKKSTLRHGATKDPRAIYLQSIMSPYAFGKNKKPVISISQVNRNLLLGRTKTLSASRILDHCDSLETYFYFSRLDAQHMLFMLDIDAHNGTGSLEGCIEFAEFLREYYLPGLYFEVSTNGNGIHGYIRIRTEGIGNRATAALVRNTLERVFRDVLKTTNFDVSGVEIKGMPMGWAEVDGMKQVQVYGTLAKLPRLSSLEDLESLQRTTELGIDILNSPLWALDEDDAGEGQQTTTTQAMGSCGYWTAEAEHKVDQWTIWAEQQGLCQQQAGSRHNTTARDYAILFWICQQLDKWEKANIGISSRRIAGLWQRLYEDGFASRGFDCHRLKMMRNELSRRGLIDWTSNEYIPATQDERGNWLPGTAMNWRLGSELIEALQASEVRNEDGEREEDNTVGTMRMPLIGRGKYLLPKCVWLAVPDRIWAPDSLSELWAMAG